MVIKLIWVILAGFVAFIAASSVYDPQIILNNAFIKGLISHEVINALIVMVTVTLAVSFSLIEKVGIIRKKVGASEYGDDDKESIFSSLDSVKSKIMTSEKLMVAYLLFSTLFLVLASSTLGCNLGFKSFLIGSVLFFFLHSIILMVEMCLELYKWDLSPEDI